MNGKKRKIATFESYSNNDVTNYKVTIPDTDGETENIRIGYDRTLFHIKNENPSDEISLNKNQVKNLILTLKRFLDYSETDITL